MKPILILIGGGTASGKTTVVRKVIEELHSAKVTVITQDNYYKDLSNMSLEERKKVNYDHPDAFDMELLYDQLLTLLFKEEPVKVPEYDFIEHNRKPDVYTVVNPTKVIMLEGIFALYDPRIRELSSIELFVECDDDTRFIRRLKRDITERGRTVDNVIAQYLTTVKPMYHQFVKPTKRYADIIVPNDEKHEVAVDIIVTKIREILKGE